MTRLPNFIQLNGLTRLHSDLNFVRVMTQNSILYQVSRSVEFMSSLLFFSLYLIYFHSVD